MEPASVLKCGFTTTGELKMSDSFIPLTITTDPRSTHSPLPAPKRTTSRRGTHVDLVTKLIWINFVAATSAVVLVGCEQVFLTACMVKVSIDVSADIAGTKRPETSSELDQPLDSLREAAGGAGLWLAWQLWHVKATEFFVAGIWWTASFGLWSVRGAICRL